MGGVSLSSLYPIGSVYISVENTDVCPLELLGVGTWEKIAGNRVLQGSSGTNKAGSNIEAGLPNVTGGFWNLVAFPNQTSTLMGTGDGAFRNNYKQTLDGVHRVADDSYVVINSTGDGISFDASRVSAIYGKSNTVQPPAFVVDIWKRVA